MQPIKIMDNTVDIRKGEDGYKLTVNDNITDGLYLQDINIDFNMPHIERTIIPLSNHESGQFVTRIDTDAIIKIELTFRKRDFNLMCNGHRLEDWIK